LHKRAEDFFVVVLVGHLNTGYLLQKCIFAMTVCMTLVYVYQSSNMTVRQRPISNMTGRVEDGSVLHCCKKEDEKIPEKK
jgi:hypothetical protein